MQTTTRRAMACRTHQATGRWTRAGRCLAFLGLASVTATLAQEPPVPGLAAPTPMLPVSQAWPLGEYWQPGKVGDKDFYLASQGQWSYLSEQGIAPLRQAGLLERITPAIYSLDFFDPGVYQKSSPFYKQLVDDTVKNRWPVATIQYCVSYSKPMPSEAAFKAVGDLWIGDGMPEDPIYRLEPVFHYIKTGDWWVGSSCPATMKEPMVAFFRDQLMPRLDQELPFCRDAQHVWTRAELRQLCDLYCEEFVKKIGKPIVWGMFLSPYHMVSLPNVTCIAEKGADAFMTARGRGLMRQAGGRKFFYTWRGHEPTERYAQVDRAWFANLDRDEWGYPLPHLWYYFWRPYLIGANYVVTEGVPSALAQDIEGEGQYQFSTLGYIVKDLLDFTERHPDRGIPYAPIALLQEYTRDFPSVYHTGGTTYGSCNIPYDDADNMNHGLLCNLLFPEHRHTRYSGCYSRTAPFGEIFDILSPNAPGRPADPKIFDGYKVLFALGGQQISKDYADVLVGYVRNGGTLIVNVADIGEHLPAEFFGVTLHPETATANQVRDELDRRDIPEAPFRYRRLDLAGAEALYTSNGAPLVTRNKVGNGCAILVGAQHMIQADEAESTEGMWGRAWKKKPILNFVDGFLEHLIAGVTPVEVRRRTEDKEDLSWLINRKGDGWTVTVFNYSLKREEGIFRPLGTAKVIEEYPYKAVPFEIVCHAPTEDVMELYADRDVKWEQRDGAAVVTETLHGGEIRVYEFQPRPIQMQPCTRYVNYALNRPVTVSSTLKGYSPQAAVDGRLDNDSIWQSDTDAARHYVFDLPQWFQVDLGEAKLIDHAFSLFHTWPHESMETRQHVYRYIVEASADGQAWTRVIDESKNEDYARAGGLERWFSPVTARYVKLTVQRNSAMAGAQLVEFEVMGPEKETYTPERKSIIPAWQVRYPQPVRDVPPEKAVYLIDLKPVSVQPGWMPQGKTWEQLNGPITLFTDQNGKGGYYENGLYGESVSELVYAVPPGSVTFAAAIGFGARARNASVEFKVFVDGNEKFTSGLYLFGERVLPVVVDVRAAKELKLVVTDGGDGIANDYAWWAEARFLRE